MNESFKSSDYVNNLSWRNIAAPILALILSFLFWDVFAVQDIGYYGPGAGVPVFAGAYFGAVFLMLGQKAHITVGALALTAAALALSVSCWLYSSLGLSILNCFIILLTAAAATFLLSGQGRYGLLNARILPETIRLSFLALFTKVSHPFQLLRNIQKTNKGSLGRVLLALLISIPLLVIVLLLLISADAVFGSMFETLSDRLMAFSVRNTLWEIIRAVVLALFIASGLYFITTDAPGTSTAEKREKAPQTLFFLLPVLLLDLVYVLFCAVQIKHLFGGTEAASMAGGWAEYAREGFFQLVAVAAINLTLCLLGSSKPHFAARGGLILRLANGLMLLLTLIILASAFRRMQLYIQAFGLSVLRLMTLWGMLVILAGLLTAGWKLLRPGFSFFSVFAPFVLGTWCLFSLLNPCGTIADYNVSRYLEGSLDMIDTDYLGELGPDALPSLYWLWEDTGFGNAAIGDIERRTEYSDSWTQTKLSYRFLPED